MKANELPVSRESHLRIGPATAPGSVSMAAPFGLAYRLACREGRNAAQRRAMRRAERRRATVAKRERAEAAERMAAVAASGRVVLPRGWSWRDGGRELVHESGVLLVPIAPSGVFSVEFFWDPEAGRSAMKTTFSQVLAEAVAISRSVLLDAVVGP